jgi:hypothetical protein
LDEDDSIPCDQPSHGLVRVSCYRSTMPQLRSLLARLVAPFAAGLVAALWTTSCGTSSTAGGAGEPNAEGGTQGDASTQDARVAGGDLCNNAPSDVDTSKSRARSCALGDDARSFVRGAPYTKVLVEIAATKSATPSQAAIDHLTVVMRDLLDKPGGVTVEVDPPLDDVGHPVTLAEAAAIEDGSRRHYSQGDTAVFYYLVVSEASTDDTAAAKILGYAFRPSSMVVFQKSIFAVSGGLAQPTHDTVEATVVAHEFGHILGLVNAGTAMQSPHEDSAHPKHDTNTGCLMYYANNSSELVSNLVSGGVLPDFDAACRADIAALKR